MKIMEIRERFYFGLTLIPVILVISHLQITLQNPIQNAVCNTPQCHRVAQNFKDSIDWTQDPCDDFYTFACGNWPKHHPALHRTIANGSGQATLEGNTRRLIEFLKKNNTAEEPKTVHKVRKLFALCTDKNTFQGKEGQFVRDLLRECGLSHIPPLFPNQSFDLALTLAKIHKSIGFMPFGLLTAPHPDNKTKNILTLKVFRDADKPHFLSVFETRDKASSEVFQQLQAKLNSLKPICFRMKWENCHALLHPWTRHFKSLQETATENGTNISTVELDDKKGQILSLNELQNLTDTVTIKRKQVNVSKFNWTRYISTLYEDIEDVTLDLHKPENIKIAVPNINAIEFIAANIVNQYPPHLLEISIWAEIVVILAMYLDDVIQNSKYNILEKPDPNKTQDEICFEACDKNFPHAVSYFYVTNPHRQEIKSEIIEMLAGVKQMLQNSLETSAWIDEETKKKAIEKLKALKSYIGYPDFIQSPERLDSYYEDLVVADNFMLSLMKTEQNKIRKKLRLLNVVNPEKDPEGSLDIAATIVNAYYEDSENLIIIPAGILGPPLYDHSLRAVTYGSMGTTVGHEVAHGYDNEGSKYNATGQLEDWWKPSTLEEYKKKARCFISAYTNYSITIQNITLKGNSHLTLSENIADNGGFKAALYAYKNYILQYGREPLLPSFENYTHEQLFTLSFANSYCDSPTSKTALKSLYETHSPDGVRVNGVMKNSQEFAGIWNCPKGSNMNPDVEKCVMF